MKVHQIKRSFGIALEKDVSGGKMGSFRKRESNLIRQIRRHDVEGGGQLLSATKKSKGGGGGSGKLPSINTSLKGIQEINTADEWRKRKYDGQQKGAEH